MGRRREALIARRVHLDFTQESLAHRLSVATATVTKWEHGTRLPAPGIRRNLAEALQVSLMDLDRLLGIEAPISLDGHEVPRWLSHFDSLVLAAGSHAKVEKALVPGLLQTKAYALAVERYGPLALTDQQIIERVDLRLARSSALDRQPKPLQSINLLAEYVLHEVIGSPDVMVEQCDHLLELNERPNIDIRLLPTDGRAACALGGFELLWRPDEPHPFMAVTHTMGGPDYAEDPLVIDRFVNTYTYLLNAALSPFDTTRRLKIIREGHHR